MTIRRSKPLPAAIWQLAPCPLPRRRRWKISLSDHPHRAAARLPTTLTLRGRTASCAPSADNSRLFPVRSSGSCIAKKHHVAAREHPDFCADGRSRRHVGGRAAAPAVPAVVSHRLQQLEAHLGVRLLNRNTRSLQLTDPGNAFYEACQDVLRAVEEAEGVAFEAGGIPTGNIRLSAPLGLGRRTLAPLVARFANSIHGFRFVCDYPITCST